MNTGQTFALVAAVLMLAAVVGLLAGKFRQPLIVAFIGVGILVGPVGTGWVAGVHEIELLAHLGVTLLLFLVGLRLDIHLVRSTGPVALATGLGQVVFTATIGYIIALALGMGQVTALYVSVALTFSSTIIIVKLLADKHELDEAHGRIAVGLLIVQDLVVILVMIGLTAVSQKTTDNLAVDLLAVIGKGIGLFTAIGLAMRYFIPWMLHLMAKSFELLVLFAVAWAVSVASVSAWLGFSTEIGAFLAGVSLASTPYREAIGARMVSLRDFLLLFFFIGLGAQLEFSDTARQLTEAGILSLFVLIGNPLIVLVVMGLMGYQARVSFLVGLTVAQISEFSLILAALGLSLGHIDSATVSLITVVGLTTIGASTYMILYSKPLFAKLEPWLGAFQRRKARHGSSPSASSGADVLVYGLGRFGSRVTEQLASAGRSVMAVDLDPDVVNAGNRRAVTTIFGNAEDIDFLESLPLGEIRWVISTIPSVDVNLTLLHALRHHDYQGRIALTALSAHDAHRLEQGEADVILRPFSAATATLLEHIAADAEGDEEK
ncbi:cation:proton antiporter [Salininema proteolyticum]|uniref:Cation:proton antiporter n=1 Tax=Salininema proteolyticum TaxID=1607685 RepID=A0ABV8U3Y1_9ACTN